MDVKVCYFYFDGLYIAVCPCGNYLKFHTDCSCPFCGGQWVIDIDDARYPRAEVSLIEKDGKRRLAKRVNILDLWKEHKRLYEEDKKDERR